ncbi:methylmalonyl Co-A mutase-associated GTPase MeaB [uncultured Bradyrhizobium sp.]|uniref:methylmalonyl Co-A mutase-associated GTPase MeaB n=1 Tax=Bradyrhizobium sp. TaxID=376 RepID=UPI0026220A5F|nr:methylmalonyl Co-A mutase-associated GTPase MeaB [uncultured Bradyrhizobium sp.]
MTASSARQRRLMARALSRAADASVAEVLASTRGSAGVCRRIGVTGPPGAGKSSLITALARRRLARDGDIAILAVDPTSPVSGGAILGDRIRMEDLAHNPRIYIRSLASRSSHDGLADNLADILEIVESAGFAEVILETVGVGQVEYAVRHVVDTTLLVLMPGAGDQIQAMKSGILETADVFVVNKADQPGARQLAAELASVLKLKAPDRRGSSDDWQPPILSTSIQDQASVAALAEAVDRHQAWLVRHRDVDERLERRRAQHVGSLVARRVAEVLKELPAELLHLPLTSLYEAVVERLTETRPSSGVENDHRSRGLLSKAR